MPMLLTKEENKLLEDINLKLSIGNQISIDDTNSLLLLIDSLHHRLDQVERDYANLLCKQTR